MHAKFAQRSVSSITTENREKDLQIAELLRSFMVELNEVKHDFLKLHVTMRNLERLLLRNEKESQFFSGALQQLTASEFKEFNDLYCLWETLLEKRFVNFLNQGVVKHYLDYPLFARFERLIERETNLLGEYTPNRVLFIGSGPMPITALCLQHRLGVPVDCLERFEDAIVEAKSVMGHLGVTEKINVMQGYGENVDVREYDVILIALLAKPKKLILENILRTCRDDVRIICRTSDGSRSVFYEPTQLDEIPKTLKVVTHASAGVDDTISSVLLRKASI